MIHHITCPQCGLDYMFDDKWKNYFKCKDCSLVYDAIFDEWMYYTKMNEPEDYKCECGAKRTGGKHSDWCPAASEEYNE